VFLEAPAWFTNLFTVCLGLVVGSFLNVVIVRLPRGESIVRPRSRCPGCGSAIRWYDNIPVASWLALRGRCRACRRPIPVRYPVVELATALLFLATRLRFGWSWLLPVRDWPFVSALVAISFIDLEHRIIPDVLSLGGLALGLLTAWFVPGFGLLPAFSGAAIGFGGFYAFAWLYQAITKRSGLGGGDVKLLAMLGAFLGPGGVFASVLISSVFGSVVGITWALLQRRAKVDEGAPKGTLLHVAIPYGPFLVVGGLYYYLLGDWIWLRFTTPM
jgi:leader peptidase (prepilin peptidase)/N-methyltransferase